MNVCSYRSTSATLCWELQCIAMVYHSAAAASQSVSESGGGVLSCGAIIHCSLNERRTDIRRGVNYRASSVPLRHHCCFQVALLYALVWGWVAPFGALFITRLAAAHRAITSAAAAHDVKFYVLFVNNQSDYCSVLMGAGDLPTCSCLTLWSSGVFQLLDSCCWWWWRISVEPYG